VCQAAKFEVMRIYRGPTVRATETLVSSRYLSKRTFHSSSCLCLSCAYHGQSQKGNYHHSCKQTDLKKANKFTQPLLLLYTLQPKLSANVTNKQNTNLNTFITFHSGIDFFRAFFFSLGFAFSLVSFFFFRLFWFVMHNVFHLFHIVQLVWTVTVRVGLVRTTNPQKLFRDPLDGEAGEVIIEIKREVFHWETLAEFA